MEDDNFFPHDHADQENPPSGNGQKPYQGKAPLHEPNTQGHSMGMATAAMILGIISLVASCCFYVSIPLGALGIILGILSKGSAGTVSSQGKTGIVLGITGICMTILLIGVILFTYIGSETFQKELNDYMLYYDIDRQDNKDFRGDFYLPIRCPTAFPAIPYKL